MVELKIKLDKKVGAVMPFQANPTDSGYDLTATSVEWDELHARLIYHTGVYLNIPAGYEVIILPRSSTSKQELFMPHSEGLIDETYNKELLVVYKVVGIHKSAIEWATLDSLGKLTLLMENAKYPYTPLTYRAGDVIAQMRMQKKDPYKLVQTDDIEDSGRGGFGSSDFSKVDKLSAFSEDTGNDVIYG
jgi:dUTP pyrophosphatase